MAKSGIHEHGYWTDHKGHLEVDAGLAAGLAAFFAGKSVADFGCGPGGYTTLFKRCGIDADGYDGNPSYEGYHIIDLAEPVKLPRIYDWVLALEVGEHIPARYEQIFINNIDQHNRHGAVVSWAVPGQGGRGHFNERTNDYISRQFEERGYCPLPEICTVLRSLSSYFWFKNTIMVFEKWTTSYHTDPAPRTVKMV